jgi:hypothetical protein
MSANPKRDPIAELAALADKEADRRAAQRASNRALFPAVAAIFDEVRAMIPNVQFIGGEENGREIGKRPTLPPNVVEIDACKAMELAAMGRKAARR